jgi:hypothetical protein
MLQVRCRSKFRCGSTVGWSPLTIAPSGSVNSGVEMRVSICLLCLTSAFPVPASMPKSKKVCQPMKRRALQMPPRRSFGSALEPFWAGSKMSPKKKLPLSPFRFAR